VARKLTLEERIRRLEQNRDAVIEQRVEAFRKRITALYDARIDLLREKGLPEAKPAENTEEMMVKAKERYVFFRYRFYVRMGLSEAEARRKAEQDYENYRVGWLAFMRG